MDPILVIGVSGSGKSTIAARLAERLQGTFLDGDDFHPRENVEHMASGKPLTDGERFPWLYRLVEELQSSRHRPPVVMACSALKRRYRDVFRKSIPGIRIIYLKGEFNLILDRMQARKGHFMKPEMLQSQFADLEEPLRVTSVCIDRTEEEIVEEILSGLGKS